jgi:hypothetical protein
MTPLMCNVAPHFTKEVKNDANKILQFSVKLGSLFAEEKRNIPVELSIASFDSFKNDVPAYTLGQFYMHHLATVLVSYRPIKNGIVASRVTIEQPINMARHDETTIDFVQTHEIDEEMIRYYYGRCKEIEGDTSKSAHEKTQLLLQRNVDRINRMGTVGGSCVDCKSKIEEMSVMPFTVHKLTEAAAIQANTVCSSVATERNNAYTSKAVPNKYSTQAQTQMSTEATMCTLTSSNNNLASPTYNYTSGILPYASSQPNPNIYSSNAVTQPNPNIYSSDVVTQPNSNIYSSNTFVRQNSNYAYMQPNSNTYTNQQINK